MTMPFADIRRISDVIDEAVEAAPVVEGLSTEELDDYHNGIHGGVRVSLQALTNPNESIEALMAQFELGGRMNQKPRPYLTMGLFAGSLAVLKLRGMHNE